MFQRTIKDEVSFQGYGIYFKENVILKCYPTNANTGIIINNKKLSINRITIENHTTVFKTEKSKIFLIEHFLAVLFILKIDNLIIEILGREFPFFDGSAKDYYLGLKDLVIEIPPNKKDFLKIKKTLLTIDKNNFILGLPKDKFSYLLISNFPDYFSFKIIKEDNSFSKIISAQTPIPIKILKGSDIKFLEERGYLQKGDWFLGKGNFFYHKLLDFVGNLKILNKEIKGKIIAFRPSHRLNIKFIKKLSRFIKNGY